MCPGKEAAVLKSGCGSGDQSASIELMRWGLVPSIKESRKADHWRMFNARKETIDKLSVFARLLPSHRCAVPLDGFYEWSEDELRHGGVRQKQPWYVHRSSSECMWLAGLYTQCVDSASGTVVTSFTLITQDGTSKLAWLHDRMPVILNDAGLRDWLNLDNSEPLCALRSCLIDPEELAWHPVTKKMSKLDYQEVDCSSPIKLISQQQRSAASFFKSAQTAAIPTDTKESDEVCLTSAEPLASMQPELEMSSPGPTSETTSSGARKSRDIRSFFTSTAINDSDVANSPPARCPICNLELDAGNREVNEHIDTCLLQSSHEPVLTKKSRLN